MKEFRTESLCRIAYFDILNGYSKTQDGLFIGHYKEKDNCELEINKQNFANEAKKAGLLSEKEQLDLLDGFGHWTKEQEEEYQANIKYLNELQFSSRKLVLQRDIDHISLSIKEQEKNIKTKYADRFNLITTTVEDYSFSKANELFILNSFYLDKELKFPLLTEEKKDNLSHKQVSEYITIYQNTVSSFTDKNIKRIAVCPFFLNIFILCQGDIGNLFGKTLTDLTCYQLHLINKCQYYKRLIDEGVKSPLEELYDDLDKVLLHYDQQWSLLLSKHNSESKN